MSEKISRRAAIAALPVVAAGASLAALPSLAEPIADAHLLHLGEQHDAAYDEYEAICNQTGVSDIECDLASDGCEAIARHIEAIPARTMDGLRVKASIIGRIWRNEYKPICLNDQQCTDVRLAQSIVTDLLETPARAASVPVEPDPVFTLIEAHRAACLAYQEASWKDDENHSKEAEDASNEAMRHEEEAVAALLTCQPTTLAGVAALLEHLNQPASAHLR